jgi:hypothetical protein
MFDTEREQARKTYQLCRFGFASYGVALVIASISAVIMLLSVFRLEQVRWINTLPWFQWRDIPIVWGRLIGALLLWGRWNHQSWRRRSGLLLALCMADLGLWFVARGEAMGLHGGDIGHEWLRDMIQWAMTWGRLALLSSLAGDYLVHLGVENARESDRLTRSMTVTGALIWMLFFGQQTNWAAGWPLQNRAVVNNVLETELLLHGFTLIYSITLIQVTALVISAARQSSVVLAEMDYEDQEDDLLRPRSEAYQDYEADWAPGDVSKRKK